MAGVDRQSGRYAGDEGEAQEAGKAQHLGAGVPGSHDQREEMQRHRGVSQPPVVAVPVELDNYLFRRVITVFAENPVNDRPEAEVQQQRQQQPELIARNAMEPDAK